MIKKLLTLSAAVLMLNAATAQSNRVVSGTAPAPARQLISQTGPSVLASKTASATVTDTLWYFFNKFAYKTPTAQQLFSVVKSPYPAAGVALTHFGSVFLNTSTVTVNGAFILASRRATSTSTAVPVRILICNASSSGAPLLPAVDSLTTVFTGTAGAIQGGNLTTPRTFTGNFAILFRNAGASTDTIGAYMAKTTPTTGVNFSENMSYLRDGGTFVTTATDFLSDYEYEVIPTVSFPMQALAQPSAPSSTCAPTSYTFTNMSTSLLTNRQFNMNMFIPRWKPFLTAPVSVADSIFVWDPGDGTGPVNNSPSMFMHTFSTPGTYTGSLTANYQLGADNGQKVMDIVSGPNQINPCAIPTGITEAASNDLMVYPNPSNGIVNVKNMGYNSTLELFNLLGESMYKEKASEDAKSIDFSRLPAGNYYLKVTSAEGKTTVKKLHFN